MGTARLLKNLQATLEATKGAAEKPSLTGTLKENAGKVKEQPTKPAPSKNEQLANAGNETVRHYLCRSGPGIMTGNMEAALRKTITHNEH